VGRRGASKLHEIKIRSVERTIWRAMKYQASRKHFFSAMGQARLSCVRDVGRMIAGVNEKKKRKLSTRPVYERELRDIMRQDGTKRCCML